jgi:hypothetical protein
MKVLYLASNTPNQSTLRIEQEITELQRAVIQAIGDPIDFLFLPALPFEDIEQQIAIHRPDIVHISAHGAPGELWLANSRENAIALTADSLLAVLTAHVPKLVYINACTSNQIASELARAIPYVIGTTADISNLAARKSAVSFYRCLLRGQTLRTAYEASAATVKTLGQGVETVLHMLPGFQASREVFCRLPQLVAYFSDHQFTTRSGEYDFKIGLAGASDNTIQVAFCTDDHSFLEESDNPTKALCFIARANAINGEIWLEDSWRKIMGDFRLYAFATTASGQCYSVAGTLCDALAQFYRVYFDGGDGPEFPELLMEAIRYLRGNDGSLLRSRI